MTLTMAWVRAQNRVEELVVASDSRLRGGYAWDAAPKILPLPRDHAVLAFAGSTDFAYPMMLQVANAVTSYARARNRAQSLEDLRGHIVRVLNGMLKQISDLVEASEMLPDAVFVLAGYSWKFDRWRIWTLYFDGGIERFTFRPAGSWPG